MPAFNRKLGETNKGLVEFPAFPSPCPFYQIRRQFVMGNCNHRFHSLCPDFRKQIVIKSYAQHVGLFVVAVGKDSGPVNRCPETAETRFFQQCQIFTVRVIEINAAAFGKICFLIIFKMLQIGLIPKRKSQALIIAAVVINFRQNHPFAILIPGAFTLTGRHCAAP